MAKQRSAGAARRTARARLRPGILRALFGVAAVGLALAAYLNSLDNPFVYDDTDTILLNRSLTDLSNVRFILVYSLFRPVVNISYAIDRALWGFTSFGFHVTNVALHAVAVGLFFGCCTRAFADARRATSTETIAESDWPAFIASALFAVHPMLTEGAGYVSGRSEVLCAVGFLGALILARRAIQTGSMRSSAGALAASAFALGSKETAGALPVVLLAYDAWILSPAQPAVAEGFRRRIWRLYVPVFAVLAVAAAVRLRTLVSAEALIGRGPIDNLLTQAIVIWRYVALLVLPVGQTIMHEVHFVTSLADPLALAALGALVALVVIAYRMRAESPLVAFGIVWFLAVLAPSSSIIPLREGMAEHRVYLASGGFFIVAALLARPLATRAAARLAMCVVVIVCAFLTVQRNVVWSSATTLWAEAAETAKSTWEPHYAYADALRETGQCGEAIPEYRRVLDERPAHRDAVTNLGICLAETGDFAGAERAFHSVLDIDPSWPRGYTNLGALAIKRGDPERARDWYRAALERDPKNVLARLQLASLDESVFHDYGQAAQLCGEVLIYEPFHAAAAECVARNRRRMEGAADGR